MRRILVALVATLTVFTLLAGCEDKPAKFDAHTVKCDDVAGLTHGTENELAAANTKANDSKGTPDEKTAKEEAKALSTKLDQLRERQTECEAEARGETTKKVDNPDGSTTIVPVVPDDSSRNQQGSDSRVPPVVPTTADPGTTTSTTSSTSTSTTSTTVTTAPPGTAPTTVAPTTTVAAPPTTVAPAGAPGATVHPILTNWCDLITQMGGNKGYIDGVNARQANTGFNWGHVQIFCALQSQAGNTYPEPRAIDAFGKDVKLPDAQLRNKVRDLVGPIVDKLNIIRHTGQSLVNTRGFKTGEMENFMDERSMTRVALHPYVLKDGKVIGIRDQAGVFVNCYNLWWIVKISPPTKPTRPPTTVTPTTVVKTTTTVPESTTTRPRGKHAGDSPVTDNPNDPCEPCRPNGTEPPRPSTTDVTRTTMAPRAPDTLPPGVTPTTHTIPPPDNPDSGSGATHTVPPPTTVAPPATVPPGPVNTGTVPSR